MDAALGAVALIEAYMARDEAAVDAVLADQADQAAIISALLRITEQCLNKASSGQPQRVLDRVRARALERVADGEDS
ncbi:hypothetical protein O6072_22985 [Mycolicibacterium neoaurum]|uniref:hypothetical protein n=1 Tax=Mycolicibacterium neoaurum TaxID=1795 RepID=UPI00248BFE8C|nr:hypothetical protein [Mycolicibacterium neoaurum]WBS07659.1 hypothetical protein O6072_22985 [Mycolicibacterium neoaurum]